jgi:kinesin family member 13
MSLLFAADDLSSLHIGEELTVCGLNSILPKEHGNKFYNLPILRQQEKDVCAVAAWDSSLHDCLHLNKVTEGMFLLNSNQSSLSNSP